MTHPGFTEQEQQALLNELEIMAEKEQAGTSEKLLIELGPFTGYLIISALQLAYFHPEQTEAMRENLHTVVDRLAANYTGILRRSIELGWLR